MLRRLRVNRVLLTVILAFSVTAPLLLSPVRLPVPERLPDLAGLMSVRDAVSEVSVPAGQGGQEGVRLESVLTWAYAAGAVAVLFVRVLLPLLSVALLLRRGRVSVYVAGGRRIRVARVPGAAPMSWMGIVILPSGKEFGDDSCVLRHELAHVLLGHSPVMLFSNLLLCLQWFNPAAWMLLRDLEQNCEFEADDAVLRSGVDRCGYQMELVGRASDGQVRNAMIMLRGADNEGSARSMLMDAVVNMPPVWSPGRIGEEPVSLSQELPLMLQMSTRS